MAAPGIGAQIIDARLLGGKLEKFSGKAEDWKGWKDDVLNYLGAVKNHYYDALATITVAGDLPCWTRTAKPTPGPCISRSRSWSKEKPNAW